MSKTQRQNREEWDAADPCRDQPLSPVQSWILQFISGACLESAARLKASKTTTVWETRARNGAEWEHRTRLAWRFHWGSEDR